MPPALPVTYIDHFCPSKGSTKTIGYKVDPLDYAGKTDHLLLVVLLVAGANSAVLIDHCPTENPADGPSKRHFSRQGRGHLKRKQHDEPVNGTRRVRHEETTQSLCIGNLVEGSIFGLARLEKRGLGHTAQSSTGRR